MSRLIDRVIDDCERSGHVEYVAELRDLLRVIDDHERAGRLEPELADLLRDRAAHHVDGVIKFAALVLDRPATTRAADHEARQAVLREARVRVRVARVNGSTAFQPVAPTGAMAPSSTPRRRESRARRAVGTRASPGDDPPLADRRCAYCGGPLPPARRHRKTCSPSHRVLLCKRRKRETVGA
jgi:hypothetical protein